MSEELENVSEAEAEKIEEAVPEETNEDATGSDAEEAAAEESAHEETEPEQTEPEGPDYLSMMLQAKIAPLEIRYAQINSPYRKVPIALRSFTYINSIIDGIIPPDKYCPVTDRNEAGIRLAKWNISHAIEMVRRAEIKGKRIQFVTARCPAALAVIDDLENWIKEVFEENEFSDYSKICLEFPYDVLFEDTEKVRMSFLNMRLMKIRTLVSGCGSYEFPVTKLFRIPAEMVTLDPIVTCLLDNRNKSVAAQDFLSFLRNLPVDVIGDGVLSDNQMSTLSRADCFGYIPSAGYVGNTVHANLRMTAEEAIDVLKENDD